MLRGSTSAISCSSASAAGVGVVQLLLEDLRARCRPRSAARPGSSASGICRSRIRTSVVQSDWLVGDARQRIQRLAVGRQQLEQLLPRLARPRQVAQRSALDQAGQLAQVLGLLRRIGDDALDLQVEDARQILEPVQRRVDLDQRVQRLAVVRVERTTSSSRAGRAGRVLQRSAQDVRDAVEDLELLVGVRGVAGVLVQHLHQLGGLVGRARGSAPGA